MVHGVLEGDEDESLSEFIESESGDRWLWRWRWQSFFCFCHHKYSIIFYYWSSWLGCRVSRWGSYFTCSMGTLWVCFLKSSFGIVKFSLLRYYQCLHPLFFIHQHHPFRLIAKLMKSKWTTHQLLRKKAMKMMI